MSFVVVCGIPLTLNTEKGIRVVNNEFEKTTSIAECVYLINADPGFVKEVIYKVENEGQLLVVLSTLHTNPAQQVTFITPDDISLGWCPTISLAGETRFIKLFGNKDELMKLRFESFWPNLVRVDINDSVVVNKVCGYIPSSDLVIKHTE